MPSPFACPRCQRQMTFQDHREEALACEACGTRARLVLGTRAVCEEPGGEPYVRDLRRI